MQTVEVKLWDDLHHRQDKERVPAEVQVELTYKTRKGSRHVRLDLTSAHGEELDEVLAPYLDAGQSPDAAARPAAADVKSGGKIRRKPPEGMPNRRWRDLMRAWSDELGLVNRDNPACPAWQTAAGKHYYPADLEDGFILHLEGREEEALALVEKFRPRAAA